MGPHAAHQAALGTRLATSLAALQAVKIATGTVGILGFVTGAVLLLAPRESLERRGRLQRWLMEIDLREIFDRRYTIEKRIYRRHRLVGLLVLAGALASLTLLVLLSNDPRSLPLRGHLGASGFRALLGVAGSAGLLLLIVGTCLLVRPSALKGIEAVSNRWIAPRRSTKHFDISAAVLRAPRIVGTVLLIAGIVCVRPF